MIWEVEPCVSNLGGLDHELSDVSKQSALAKVDFSEGDGGEELREDQIDVGRGLDVRRGGGESGGETVRFRSLLREHGVVSGNDVRK